MRSALRTFTLLCAIPLISGISATRALASPTGSWGSAGYEATSYLYAPTSGHESVFQSISIESGVRSSGEILEIGASGNLLLNVKPEVHPYFEVPELFVGSRKLVPLQIRLGRKLEPWSELDETWQLGLFQPRFRWDYLHPQSVGLTGAFAEFKQGAFQVIGFASPLYIPERGVPIHVDNGEFSSPSAWFIPPSSRITLFDRETPVKYDLQIPRVSDIIFQLSGGILARMETAGGFWSSGAYSIKPMNQLLLGHDAHLRLDALEVPVKIAPRVAYHQIASLEGGFEAKKYGFALSLLHERPMDRFIGANWTVQTAVPATAVSPAVKFRLGKSRAGPSLLSLGYFRRWGGNGRDAGRDASDISVFESRYPFRSALRLAVSSAGVFGLASENLTGASRMIYDSSEDGAIWSTEFKYRFSNEWRMNLGADFLATQVAANTPELDSSNFIRRYQVHNRIQAGISYVF